MSNPHNQAMEPVGLGALTPADQIHAPAPAHDAHGHAPAARRYQSPSGTAVPGFTGAEIVGAVGLIVFLVALCAGSAALLATIVALCHWAFVLPMGNTPLAHAWGNAVGSVLAIVLVFVMILATLLTMGERKWSAFIQDRMGPNRARLPGLPNTSLWGLPHIAADVLKMLTKEEIVPAMGSKVMFHLAPALAFGPAFVLFAVIPMSPTFTWLGQPITMQVASINQGLLYIFAVASIAVFGTSLAGWSSNNKYALLGGIRASAQMISYEVTLGLTLVGLMIVFQTVRLDSMTVQQGEYLWGFLPKWGVFFQPLAIFAYFAAASAEIKRAPFDTPEGESEIVGYFIEYSGLKFGIFMIAEFVEVVVFAGLFSALFFGGYHWGLYEDTVRVALADHPAILGLIYTTVFVTKTVFFCWLSLAVRWTYPRFRYDQVMHLGWKMLLPLSLANVLLTGIVVLWGGTEGAAILGLVELAFVALWVIGAFHIHRRGDETLLPAAHDGHGAHGHDAHAVAHADAAHDAAVVDAAHGAPAHVPAAH